MYASDHIAVFDFLVCSIAAQIGFPGLKLKSGGVREGFFSLVFLINISNILQ